MSKIKDNRILFKTLENLYVPSGWCIDKNHVFDINKQGFLSLKNENERFWAEDFFISSSIFYAKQETTSFTAVVDIGCKLDNGDMDAFSLKYDVNFWLYANRKRKNMLILSLEEYCTKGEKALKIASEMMKNFSHGNLEVEGYDLDDIYN